MLGATARLLLARSALRGRAMDFWLKQFTERGAEGERIVFRPAEAVNLQHLRIYEEIDVAFDPFP
jgi:hypothetical protein